MKPIGIVIIGLFLMLPCAALSDDREAAVRTAIQAFYEAFDDGFVGPADYATEDWNHISPYGGRGQGRETVRAALNEVHKTLLKGTTKGHNRYHRECGHPICSSGCSGRNCD